MITTFFLTGATGFLGRRVIENLLNENGQIFALVRKGSESKLNYLKNKRLTFVRGDVTKKELGISNIDRKFLKHKVTHLIHCAGLRDPNTRSAEVFRVNVTGTKNTLNFAKKLPKLKVFIHISSKAVAGNYEGEFPEQSLPEISNFHNDYEKSKYQAENLVRNNNFEFIIIRPPTIIGDSHTGEVDAFDGSLYRIISAMEQRKLLFYPGLCDGFLHTLPVDTVARFCSEVSMDPTYVNITFNLSASPLLTFREFIDMTSKLLGVSWPSFTMPSFLWNLFIKVFSYLPFLNTGSLSLFNQKLTYENDAFMKACKKHKIVIPALRTYLPNIIHYYQEKNG